MSINDIMKSEFLQTIFRFLDHEQYAQHFEDRILSAFS